MKKEVVLVFDIGKTNKKVLLFDRDLIIRHEEESVFGEIPDDDGFMGEDIGKLEAWIMDHCWRFLDHPGFEIKGINFATYGATLMYLGAGGNRLTPVYNYLKPMPEGVVDPLYKAYGGEAEFCRRTASPALGMLNSGLQALWLKEKKPGVFGKVKTILHFPQYLSYLLTGRVSSEHTSLGCHTALWDFDNMQYHPWTRLLGNVLPDPIPVETTFPSKGLGKTVPVGIGIHDSSSSLAPYFMGSGAAFILVSTGTWCISMNPFNEEALTAEQLNRDCLAYMSIQKKPVKSSRLFMGRIHDVNVQHLNEFYGAGESDFKKVALDENLLASLHGRHAGRVFFKGGVPENHLDTSITEKTFASFEEAYHRLMIDLADLTAESIRLIIPRDDRAENIYVSGGFSKNPIFIHLMASHFPEKKVLASEVANATSLGAALITWKATDPEYRPRIDLGIGS
jgi:sugar (pentulose or hexulose) kinase